jgi:hypothetical protein
MFRDVLAIPNVIQEWVLDCVKAPRFDRSQVGSSDY